MKSGRSYCFGLIAAIIFAVILSGCAGKAEKAVQQPIQAEQPEAAVSVAMNLKFAVGDAAKYKVVMDGRRGVKWEGDVPDKPSFQSGQNASKVEITFTQNIQDVDENGNATAVITIEQLKYLSSIKESTIIDFDSSRSEDANAAMAGLIGQSYTIEITPSAQLSGIDANSAMAAVKGDSPAQRAAMRLVDAEVIADRHGLLYLPADESRIIPGENWKDVKTFSFGLMGPVSYERIYTLKEVQDSKATVEMKSVPAAAQDSLSTTQLAKKFDHKGDYRGELIFDTYSGQITKYWEHLDEEWLAARPPEENDTDGEPMALTMTASRFYSLEKIE